jgi:hypothetical protein
MAGLSTSNGTRSELRLAALGAGASLLLTAAVAGVFGLVNWNLTDWSHSLKITEIGIAVTGGIFAILAMLDAHRAFRKAREVQEAVGSFRMSFRDVMEEMVLLLREARQHLVLLLPTAGYGYLFGEPELSSELVTALEKYLELPNTTLDLYLIGGDRRRLRESIPQRYLLRAFALQRQDPSRHSAADYIKLVEHVFTIVAQHSDRVTLHLLKTDPNVRIVISDPQDVSSRACLLAFAQDKPDDIAREFRASGFRSTRVEMVRAMLDLVQVYSAEMGEDVVAEDVRDIYTVLQ